MGGSCASRPFTNRLYGANEPMRIRRDKAKPKKQAPNGRGSPSRVKKLVRDCFEGLLAILLVLLFFSGFLYFLNSMFPTGTSLRSLVARHTPLSYDGTTVLKPTARQEETETGTRRPMAAKVQWVRNNVKSKRAEAIAWQSADAGKVLYDRDAVQTLDRSAARIEFDENTSLQMGQNSLLIIKKMTHDPVFKEKRSFMVLVDGDMRGKLAGDGGDDSVFLEIGTPTATVRTAGGPQGGGPVDFKISVNPDKTSTVAVYAGSADVEAGGRIVTVGANQATVVDTAGKVLDPAALPPPVQLHSPSEGGRYVYRDLPPRVNFGWQDQPAASEFRFMLARDRDFRRIVTDEAVSGNRFRHGNLQADNYYWKVSAKSGTVEGFFSDVRQFRVVQDRQPPRLEVRFPQDTLHTGRYLLNGSTEPGARVYIGGVQVQTRRNGKFEYPLKLKPGLNVIVVEAFDAVDNVTYRSKKVISKY